MNIMIDEEIGTVYFKDLRATDTRGNMTAQQNIYTGLTGATKIPSAYSGAWSDDSIGTGDGSTVTFNNGAVVLTNLPILPRRVRVTAGTITLEDDGNGVIYGPGGSGTVNYTTGAISVTFTTAPASSADVNCRYAQDFEGSTDIPEIDYVFSSKSVTAEMYALKTTIGMFKSFALRKRFGTIAEDEAATDLVNAINAEIFGVLLAKIKANANGTTTFAKTPPSGVSYTDHKQTFKDKLADAEAVMLAAAGRGMLNWGVVGTELAAVISTLPGFTKIYDGATTSGGHLFGTLDGMPIIRIPLVAQLAAASGVFGYKGSGPFEAAVSYNPYMPLTVTDVLQTGTNPLTNQRAAAVWAACEVLVPKFITNLNMTA